MALKPSELSDCSRWLLQRPINAALKPAFSIAIEISCPACQPSVSRELARYLNEFSDLPAHSWKSFDPSLIERLARSPLKSQLGTSPQHLIQTLTKRGGAILEGPDIVSLTEETEHTFQVCLACQKPEGAPFHLHLNQKRFDPRRVVSVIADSFLEWVDGGGDPSPSTAFASRATDTSAFN